MRCPTLNELPPPPPGKTGWPWSEESPQLPDAMPGGSPWPRISIVTPSFNQGQFIEETIRSVLLQGYPDLEYIIIDGGSTDESVEIIKKYAPWLAYWVSEKDRGQSHAINKALSRTNGKILAYLNSDDVYSLGTFADVAVAMAHVSFEAVVHANCAVIDEYSIVQDSANSHSVTPQSLLQENYLCQPAIFFPHKLWEVLGPFREDLHYVMDWDYWLRAMMAGFSICYEQKTWAQIRLWSGCKTRNQELGMSQERYQRLLQLAETETARQWPAAWWNDGLASAAIWQARAALVLGQTESVAPWIGKAIAHSPAWVRGRENALAAELARLSIDQWNIGAMETCQPVWNELCGQSKEGARLASTWESWQQARIAGSLAVQGQRIPALSHFVRAFRQHPQLLADRYYGRLFAKTLLKAEI